MRGQYLSGQEVRGLVAISSERLEVVRNLVQTLDQETEGQETFMNVMIKLLRIVGSFGSFKTGDEIFSDFGKRFIKHVIARSSDVHPTPGCSDVSNFYRHDF
jgi:hypothetical protein